MSTAYPQHIHTIMFTITLPSTLALLFIYAFLFTMWYFSTITSQLTLQQYFQHILNIYLGYCLQLHYPVYWLCCLYMLPLHNVIFFHNYCTIDSATMSTAYPQHIHTVMFTITLPSTLALLFIYAFLFTIWYFFTITAQLTLQQCLQHILNIYIQYCLQLLSLVYLLCCLHMPSFSQCEYFPHITVQLSIWKCFIESSLLHTVLYTITPHSILTVLFTFAFLFTICYFFTITAQLTLQQCFQHILNIYI